MTNLKYDISNEFFFWDVSPDIPKTCGLVLGIRWGRSNQSQIKQNRGYFKNPITFFQKLSFAFASANIISQNLYKTGGFGCKN